jgi:hypothetical protein
VEGSASSETKEEMSKSQPSEKKDGGGTSESLGTIGLKEGAAGAVITVRTKPRGKKARLITDVTGMSPQKRGNGDMPVGYSG